MTLAGKKIITFCGRVHHAQRLDGIMQAIERDGGTALWIVADNSINIDISSVYLIQNGKKFIHALDYFPSGFSGNLAGWASHLLSTINGENDIRSFVDPFWLSHSVYEACEYLLCFNQ